jgi:molybdate transport system substrate-binding protein
MSKEGLGELIAAGRIAAGSDAELATAALGAAVRQGQPKPDLGSVEAFKRAVVSARLVAIPASTSGIFLKDEVFPKLGIAEKVKYRVMARGAESTALLAAGEADLALGPVSELLDQPGIEPAGVLPDEVQLIQMFVAAIVNTSRRSEQARRLIEFLTSEKSAAAIRNSGMEPVGKRR